MKLRSRTRLHRSVCEGRWRQSAPRGVPATVIVIAARSASISSPCRRHTVDLFFLTFSPTCAMDRFSTYSIRINPA